MNTVGEDNKMKFIFVVGENYLPTHVDDINIKHDSAIIIEDEYQNNRVCIGLERDDELSKPYKPYYVRVMNIEKLIYLRDELTKLIEGDGSENETRKQCVLPTVIHEIT